MAEISKNIFFIGTDKVYLDLIKNNFAKEFPEFTPVFHSFDIKQTNECQILLKILGLKPSIIYLDFTHIPVSLHKLLKLIKMEPLFKDMAIICITDSKEKTIKLANRTKENIQIKCAEKYNIVFDPYYQVAFKEKTPATVKFATAKIAECKTELEELIQVISVAPSYIIAEGNAALIVDEIITLNTSIPIKAIPSNKFIVSKISSSKINHNYLYQYELAFIFVDEPVKTALPPETTEADTILYNEEYSRKQEYYKDRVEIAKNRNKKWVQHNAVIYKHPLRLVLIDSSFSFWNHINDLIDNKDLSIKCQSQISEKGYELIKFAPKMVIYNFTNKATLPIGPIPIKEPNEYLDMENRKLLFMELKVFFDTINKFLPKKDIKVVIFNAHNIDPTYLKEQVAYDELLTTNDQFSIKFINDLLLHHNKKVLPKVKDPICYLEEGHSLEFATLVHQINITKINENELFFTSNRELSLSNFRIEYPTGMLAQAVITDGKPYTLDNKLFLYHALLNGIDENDKKALRRFVNKIFGASKEEKEAQDLAAFQDLNKKVADTKQQEEEKKKAEEAATDPSINLGTYDTSTPSENTTANENSSDISIDKKDN